MEKILGVDLGTNSIGWAIRNKSKRGNQIKNSGVLRFDKGVGEEKGKEFPKVKKRTESRGRRRNYQAEKYRKFELLKFLIGKDLCPLSWDDLQKWQAYKKGEKRKYPQSKVFINWLNYDFDGDGKPDFHLFNLDKHESHYVFRVLAVSEKKEHRTVFDKNPHLLGRVLYHLVQRRGFRGKENEEAKTMLEGSAKLGIPGRNSIEEYLIKYKTLGAALYYYQKDNGGRIRVRYNLRKDYEFELKEISRMHSFTDEEYKKLWKAIIWQRPLRSQKGLIGLCTFEKGKRRVAIGHPLYQEYKTWVLINNLKINPPQGQEKSSYLKENIYPLFIRKSDFTIKDIISRVKKDHAKIDSKFHKKKELKTKVVALSNFYDFNKSLGNDWKEKYGFNDFFKRPSQPSKKSEGEGYSIDDIWHVLNTFDNQESLYDFAKNKLKLSKEKAETFSKIRLKKGYGTLSLSAVKKVLPYLRRGYLFSHAIYLANLPKVFGEKEISEEMISAFISEIDPIKKNIDEIKSLNNVVNSMITNHLNEDNRYFIENDRKLDESEILSIKETLIIQLGKKKWENLDDEKRKNYVDYVSGYFKNFLKKRITDSKDIFIKQPRLHKEIFKSLQEKYDLPNKNIKYLWHPSVQEKYPNAEDYFEIDTEKSRKFISESKIDWYLKKHPKTEKTGRSLKLLGLPEPISRGFKNPMALKSLYRLKWLINYLLQTNQIDEYTKIVVEMARDGGLNDSNKRAAIRKWQQKREKENEEFKNKIDEFNTECNTKFDREDKDLLKKLRLWKEQECKCLYTGETISICDVFNANKYDFEHTIPQKMSFDNELKNLTLANSIYNRNIKQKRIPFELENYNRDAFINGTKYSAIKPRLKFISDKIESIEVLIKANIFKVKSIAKKEKKDEAIQERHILKLDLAYWKSKYQTFTCEEYKIGWRNSQLRDTQTMTKWALPYLKTIFRIVTAQTGITVNKFKEIYGVKLYDEKKDRSNHAHHAIDAAVLTLIPNSYHREKILEKYHNAKDQNQQFHDNPIDWENFNSQLILQIKDHVLVNYLKDERIFTPTFKKVRKGGKIRLNKKTDQPLLMKGDAIRGQLHTDSFYGAIMQPKRNNKRKIEFDENGNMLLDDSIRMVIRKKLVYKSSSDSEGFKTFTELERVIVDKDLLKQIKTQVGSNSFKAALEKGFWRLDKLGNRVNKIRRVRCFEDQNLKYNSALQIKEHIYKSKFNYKQFLYSKNAKGSLIYCLFYKNKKIRPIGLYELYLHKISSKQELLSMDCFRLNGRYPYTILTLKQHFFFFKENKEELKELDKTVLLKRLYWCSQFEQDGRIQFRHHLIAYNAHTNNLYGTSSKISFETYTPFLRLTARNFNFVIEGVDFNINLDGEIKWLF